MLQLASLRSEEAVFLTICSRHGNRHIYQVSSLCVIPLESEEVFKEPEAIYKHVLL